jgi:hypothetical protein
MAASSFSSLAATLFAALTVVVGFTSQNVTIVYWTDVKGISAFGILALCGLFFGVLFGTLLLLFALVYRDPRALWPSDDPAECAIFVWPFCRTRRGEPTSTAELLSPRRSGLGGYYGVLADAGEGRGRSSRADTAIFEEVQSSVRLTRAQVLLLIGFLNAMNGFLIVYASPSARTPPLVQAIIQNAGVIFSVPFSLLALGDRKRYCSPLPALAALLIAASVGVSLAPAIMSGNGVGSSASALGWCAVYLAGIAASAAYNVTQQLFFVRAGMLRAAASTREQVRTSLRALFWANVAQPLTYVAFFWVDLLPWFGTSTNAGDLLRSAVFSGACSVGGAPLAQAAVDAVGAPPGGPDASQCGSDTPIWAWAFLFSYAASYAGGARLNRESATFMMLTLVVVTMTTAAFWLIPGTNPNPTSTPLWSVMASLGLSIVGTLLWKWWENRTPAEEQFLVQPDPDVVGVGGDEAGDASRESLLVGQTFLSGGGGGGSGGDADSPSSMFGGRFATRWGGGGGSGVGVGYGGGREPPSPRVAIKLNNRMLASAYDDLLNDAPMGPVDVVTSGRAEIANLVNSFQVSQAQAIIKKEKAAAAAKGAAPLRRGIN